MGRAAGSRFVVFGGGESVTETRALGAVSAISFGCASACVLLTWYPPIKLLCNNEDTV